MSPRSQDNQLTAIRETRFVAVVASDSGPIRVKRWRAIYQKQIP